MTNGTKELHVTSINNEYIPGLTSAWQKVLEEAAIMCLEDQQHKTGALMKVDGEYQETYNILWPYNTTETMRRCYQDEEQTTEWGACCIAILLILELTDFKPMSRSWKTTGFDYWLWKQPPQPTNPNFLSNGARLEVSGIRHGSLSKIAQRSKQKLNQPSPSNSTGLPAYAIVVEFSLPLSRIAKR